MARPSDGRPRISPLSGRLRWSYFFFLMIIRGSEQGIFSAGCFLVPSQVTSFHHRRTASTRRSVEDAPSDPSHRPRTSQQFLLIPSQVLRSNAVSSSGARLTQLHASTAVERAEEPASPSNASDSPTLMKKKAKSRRKPRRRQQQRNSNNNNNETVASLTNGCIPTTDAGVPRTLAKSTSLGSGGECESVTDGENESDDGPLELSSSEEPNAEGAFLREGNLPDVYWRSLPMEHLRLHPRFVPLPESRDLQEIEDLEDVRQFRQDSWQWDALHVGRCTTSQAVAALGFLENMAGDVLQVPAAWRRGGRGAYQRLGQASSLRTVDDVNRVLLVPSPSPSSPSSGSESSSSTATAAKPPSVWSPYNEPQANDSGGRSEPAFAARYNHRVSMKELDRRRKLARQFSTHDSASSLRLTWGSVQEATALLTALNYFAENDPAFVMKEVGMCGAGLSMNETSSSLLLGASPDAVLCHGDGSIEALEVKNHCPFVTPFLKKGKSRPSKRFRIGDRHLAEAGIFAQYVPQLMLEMLCLGDACRSAVMVRQSATKGALLLRVRRDDEWIDEMLHFLRRFQDEFVSAGRTPPPNFFFLGEDQLEVKRYRRFLNKTLEVRNGGVEVIAHIPPESIQRAQNTDTPLFLD